MRWPTRLGVLLGLLALAGCAQKFGEDYCVAEKRQVPDREKMVRFFMRHDATGFEWQSQARGAPHFIQWMAREAPDPEAGESGERLITR